MKCSGKTQSSHEVLGNSLQCSHVGCCGRENAHAECLLRFEQPMRLSSKEQPETAPCVKKTCCTREAADAECALNLGASSSSFSKAADSGYSLSCKDSIPHQQLGLAACSKTNDLNGNTGVAFRNNPDTAYPPTLVFEFEHPKAFSLLWLYKHPTTHMYRQVKSLNVLCTNSAGKEKHLETFDVQASDGWNAVAGGWIMLPLKKSCPEASKLWMIEMKASAKTFYLMDLVFGNHAEERKLLPSPSSNKVNGYCVAQQRVSGPAEWRAMGWVRDRWQALLSFKPETSRIPPGSTFLVQLMFDETRVDWPAELMATPGPGSVHHTHTNPTGVPECVLSIIHGGSSTLYAGSAYTLMDSRMVGEVNPGWNKAKTACGKQWSRVKDTCGDSSKIFMSQFCPGCATSIKPNQLGHYQAGDNVTIVVRSPAQTGTWHFGCRPNNCPAKFNQRCAVRGDAHITYWYRPLGDGPCVVKSPPTPTPLPIPTPTPTSASVLPPPAQATRTEHDVPVKDASRATAHTCAVFLQKMVELVPHGANMTMTDDMLACVSKVQQWIGQRKHASDDPKLGKRELELLLKQLSLKGSKVKK